MNRLMVSPPSWDKLHGGTGEAAWLADRSRKHGLATDYAGRLITAADALEKLDALFECSPAALKAHSFAADWYISLAGFAMKTLSNVKAKPAAFDLHRAPKGLVESLRRQQSVKESDLQAFSNWINDELAVLIPKDQRDPKTALVIAALIVGGRIIGIGQNTGGDDAVTLLKEYLIGELAKRGPIEVSANGIDWTPLAPGHSIADTSHFRFRKRITLQFVPGGDRPDMLVTLVNGKKVVEVLASAEVKGRKDLSNAWESWMPQVDAHVREWRESHPKASILFFGTLITKEMINGVSLRGTSRPGFKSMHAAKHLDAVYNLSRLSDQDTHALDSFAELVERLDDVAKA